MKNLNLINLISLTEDSLRSFYEDKLSAKDSVFQAFAKASIREGKDPFSSSECFGTEEEAAERSLLELALESAVEEKVLTFKDYMDWLKKNHLQDSDENSSSFRQIKKAADTIVDCLRSPRFIEKNKNWLGEEAVKMLNYITTGGITHKAPSFVIA